MGERLESWRAWLDIVGNEITHLAHVDDVFWQVQAIVGANPSINKGDIFQEWLGTTYVSTLSVGLRRLVDRTKGTVSLVRVLDDMKRHASQLTKRRYLKIHEGHMRRLAEDWFKDLAGGDHDRIPKKRIQELIDTLNEAFVAVRQYANQHVAHRSEAPTNPPVRFADVRDALVQAFKTYRWCQRVLWSSMPTSPVPVIQTNWLSVFTEPWLNDTKDIPNYRHLDEMLKVLD